MIELRGIEKSYLVGARPLQVIRGIDLDIRLGEFVAIMGRSGSGKSSLLNIIGCLDVATSGRYCLGGQDVSLLNDNELARIRNLHFGFVFQNFNLIARNSALKNVEKPLIYRDMPASSRREKAAAILDKVGLSDRLEHYPAQLSGGQQQRVAIARALVANPSVIIADEPTGSLDSLNSKEIMSLLRQFNEEGRTVVMVTHDKGMSEYADRVIELADGRLCA